MLIPMLRPRDLGVPRASAARRSRIAVGTLLAANLVLLVAFQTSRDGASYDTAYGWVGNLAMLVPTVACFACAWLSVPRRAPAIWLGLAMLSQTAGNVLVSTWLQFEAHPPVPSPS